MGQRDRAFRRAMRRKAIRRTERFIRTFFEQDQVERNGFFWRMVTTHCRPCSCHQCRYRPKKRAHVHADLSHVEQVDDWWHNDE